MREAEAMAERSMDEMLTELVGALRKARELQSDWHHERADRRKRPVQEAVVGIVRNLRAALFPSHFGGFEFGDDGIDAFIARSLVETLVALEEQVSRSLRYSPSFSEADEHTLQTHARAVTRAFAERLP